MTLNAKHFFKHTILRPFEEFLHIQSSGGILLLAATIIALLWANSPLSESYVHFWEIPLGLSWGSYTVSRSLHFWINEGLMGIFFFLVGLEIKREILAGELSSLRSCLFPVFAAIGGMLLPAAIYLLLNHDHPASLHGWGIPMATDIAFAVGVMALLGSRIPLSLKVFLTALAIVDDLGAVLVIALFYTGDISWLYLSLGIASLLLMALMNFAGVRSAFAYGLLGIAGAWVFFLLSGVHATVASVLAALAIPVNIRMDVDSFVQQGQRQLDYFRRHEDPSILITPDQKAALHALESLTDRAQSPLQHLENILHPWVSHLIMPLFALANAGIFFEGKLISGFFEPASLGIFLGLLVGKPAGIFLFAWLSVKLKWASLPTDLCWKQIFGTGLLAGMGFTMSIFIATLAFSEAGALSSAKFSILMGSLLSGVGGGLILFLFSKKEPIPMNV